MARDPLLDPPSWAPRWLPTVDDLPRHRLMRWVVGGVFAAGLGACVLESANAPADPTLEPTVVDDAALDPTPSTTGAPGTTGTPDTGGASELAATFGTILGRLVTAAGEVLELCLLDADELAQRQRGLMGVTDLGEFDGMVFRNDVDSTGGFFMFRTLVPLRIGWFASDGAFVSAADMVPCESEDPAACETYFPDGAYRFAVEVFAGDPTGEAFAPGTRLELGGACPA